MRIVRTELAAEARRILALAWPVALMNLNWTLMQLIDVAVVGHASTAELGKIAAARALWFITIVMGVSIMSGVLVFSARADGAGDLPETGRQFRAGLLLGLIVGFAELLLLYFAGEPLLRLMGVAPALAAGGGAVVRVLGLAYPFTLAGLSASFFLEGISRPRRVAAVNLAMLPLNALLAWALVAGRLGLPALGAVGAAAATTIVSIMGCAAMLVSAWTVADGAGRGVRDVSRAAWVQAWRDLPGLAWFGAVPSVAAGLELAGFSWLIVLSTRLGDLVAAAFQAAFSLHNFAFAMAMGFASAAGVRTGNAVGAGEHGAALPRALIAAGLAALLLAGIGAAYLLSARQVTGLFSGDPAVVALAASLLTILAPFMLFDGIQLVCVYALRSLGDQVAAGGISILAYFVVTGGAGWWLVRVNGAAGLMQAAAAGMVAAGLLQAWRLWAVGRGVSGSARSPG